MLTVLAPFSRAMPALPNKRGPGFKPTPSDRDGVHVHAVEQQPPADQGCLADSCLEKSRPESGPRRTTELCGQSVIKLAPWPRFI